MLTADIHYRQKDFALSAQLNLRAGEIHALLGASGSGKTTLLRLLSGLLTPNEGTIRCGERTLFDSQSNTNIPPQQRNIGLVFQNYALFDHMSVLQNIAYGVAKANTQYVAEEWLRRLGLSDKANVYPDKLSGGEQQRVALARSLAASPDVLLLDEPFAALNIQLRVSLRQELKQLVRSSGLPVFIAIHDLQEARLLADRVSVLADGELLQTGDTATVFAKPNSMASARALGWQNLLSVAQGSEIGLNLQPGSFPDGATHIAIPESAIRYDESNGHFEALVLDTVSLDNARLHCTLRLPSGLDLQAVLNLSAAPFESGGSAKFAINYNELVWISEYPN